MVNRRGTPTVSKSTKRTKLGKKRSPKKGEERSEDAPTDHSAAFSPFFHSDSWDTVNSVEKTPSCATELQIDVMNSLHEADQEEVSSSASMVTPPPKRSSRTKQRKSVKSSSGRDGSIVQQEGPESGGEDYDEVETLRQTPNPSGRVLNLMNEHYLNMGISPPIVASTHNTPDDRPPSGFGIVEAAARADDSPKVPMLDHGNIYLVEDSHVDEPVLVDHDAPMGEEAIGMSAVVSNLSSAHPFADDEKEVNADIANGEVEVNAEVSEVDIGDRIHVSPVSVASDESGENKENVCEDHAANHLIADTAGQAGGFLSVAAVDDSAPSTMNSTITPALFRPDVSTNAPERPRKPVERNPADGTNSSVMSEQISFNPRLHSTILEFENYELSEVDQEPLTSKGKANAIKSLRRKLFSDSEISMKLTSAIRHRSSGPVASRLKRSRVTSALSRAAGKRPKVTSAKGKKTNRRVVPTARKLLTKMRNRAAVPSECFNESPLEVFLETKRLQCFTVGPATVAVAKAPNHAHNVHYIQQKPECPIAMISKELMGLQSAGNLRSKTALQKSAQKCMSVLQANQQPATTCGDVSSDFDDSYESVDATELSE